MLDFFDEVVLCLPKFEISLKFIELKLVLVVFYGL